MFWWWLGQVHIFWHTTLSCRNSLPRKRNGWKRPKTSTPPPAARAPWCYTPFMHYDHCTSCSSSCSCCTYCPRAAAGGWSRYWCSTTSTTMDAVFWCLQTLIQFRHMVIEQKASAKRKGRRRNRTTESAAAAAVIETNYVMPLWYLPISSTYSSLSYSSITTICFLYFLASRVS